MYSIKQAFQFDVNAEIAAMVEFLSTRWKNVENVEALLRVIAQVAEKNAHSAIVDTELSIYLMEQEQARGKSLKLIDESGGMLRYYDQACLLMEGLQRQVRKVYAHGNESLYTSYDAAMKSIKKALAAPGLSKLRNAQPRGLEKMTQHYRENDKAWDIALENEFYERKTFNGADTAGATQGGFVSAVNLTMVVQVVEAHNTPPIDQLICGVYDHLVNIHRAANSHAVQADLAMAFSHVKPDEAVFVMNFVPTHKLTKVLYTLVQENQRELGKENPEQDYLNAVAERKAAKPLSEEELKVRRAEAARLVSSMLKSTLKSETSKQAKAREARQEQELNAVDGILKSL